MRGHVTPERRRPSVEGWAADRLGCAVVHLDVAACGRVSTAVLGAEVAHLRAEASQGGYVAQAAADDGRDALQDWLGGAQVAFSDNAGNAFATLMRSWPLGRGAAVGTVGSEYGGNAFVLDEVAAQRGWRLVPLPTDPLGRITDVPAGLDLITFPQVASQRGVLQPVEQVLSSEVPLVLDVAQSLGQVAVPPGCAGYVGTSRKWLCGPRGVGFLAVDPHVEPHLRPPLTLNRTLTGMARFDTPEAHVAGRVGLAVAAGEWSRELTPVILSRASYARQVLAGRGWQVVEPVDEPTGITTLRGGDPVQARATLLERGFLVSAVPAGRSPDLDEPVLRVSTAAWVSEADLDALADAFPPPPRR